MIFNSMKMLEFHSRRCNFGIFLLIKSGINRQLVHKLIVPTILLCTIFFFYVFCGLFVWAAFMMTTMTTMTTVTATPMVMVLLTMMSRWFFVRVIYVIFEWFGTNWLSIGIYCWAMDQLTFRFRISHEKWKITFSDNKAAATAMTAESGRTYVWALNTLSNTR